MGHRFLSEGWINAVKALHAEYDDRLPQVDIPAVRVNLDITGVPADVASDGVVHTHADTNGPGLTLDVGPLEDPDLTVTVDHDTAYDLLVDQRPNAAIGAFLTGRIKIDGDMHRLAESTSFDPAALPGLLSSLGITGSTTLADVDPVAAEIGERIRALTA